MPGQVLCHRTQPSWGLATKVVSKPLPAPLPPTREVFPGPPGVGVSPQLSSQQGRSCWAGHVPAPSTRTSHVGTARHGALSAPSGLAPGGTEEAEQSECRDGQHADGGQSTAHAVHSSPGEGLDSSRRGPFLQPHVVKGDRQTPGVSQGKQAEAQGRECRE